jgi:hypothetical protein
MFRIDGVSPFQIPNRLIRTDAHRQLAVLRRFLQEGNMAAVQEVKAAGNEDFLSS